MLSRQSKQMRHVSSNDVEIYRREEENDERQQRKQGKTW